MRRDEIPGDSYLMHMSDEESRNSCPSTMCQQCSGCEQIEPIHVIVKWEHNCSDTISDKEIEMIMQDLSEEFSYSGVQITYIHTKKGDETKSCLGQWYINGVRMEELVPSFSPDDHIDKDVMRSALFSALYSL